MTRILETLIWLDHLHRYFEGDRFGTGAFFRIDGDTMVVDVRNDSHRLFFVNGPLQSAGPVDRSTRRQPSSPSETVRPDRRSPTCLGQPITVPKDAGRSEHEAAR